MSKTIGLSEGVLVTEAGVITVPSSNLPVPIPAGNLPSLTAYSRQIPIAFWATPKATTGGAWAAQGGAGILPVYMQSSGAQNDSATYDFACDAGTYTLDFYHFAGSSRGIYTLAIDGVTVGTTIDGYNSSTTTTISTITGIVLTAGQHTFKMTMATKNASSSNYYAVAVSAVLTRTA
jgi:hypothetical protein